MDSYVILAICFAAVVLSGREATNGSIKYNVQIVETAKAIDVTCGEPFTLSCTMNTSNATCVWNRNATVVQQEDRRYSYNSTTNDSCTVCVLFVPGATDIDSGNWNCGTQASDKHDGSKSSDILVKVRPNGYNTIPGMRCDNKQTKMEENPSEVSSPDSGRPHDSYTLYVYIGIGLSVTIIVSLISATIYLKCRNRDLIKDKENQRQLSPIYEEIAENPIRLSETETMAQPSTSNLQVCPRLPTRAHKKTSIRIKEILDLEGYQVPVKKDGSLLIRDGILILQSLIEEESPEDIELTSIARPLPEPIIEIKEKIKSSSSPLLKVPSNPNHAKLHSYENVSEIKSKDQSFI